MSSQHGDVKQASASAGQVTSWLCFPGHPGDPCSIGRAATVVATDGSRSTQPSTSTGSGFDCFYAYPTASNEPGHNADLRTQMAEVATAEAQASRFSQVCRVFAPLYRQVTVAGLRATVGLRVPAAEDDLAYQSLAAGFAAYLQQYNDGRPFILIGHSQGAAVLIRLIRAEIDGDATLRRRLVLAILPGGNVQVPAGKLIGGSFEHVPLCAATGESGCVIAYSSFPGPPPPTTLFGRAGTGVSHLSEQKGGPGLAVACTDPADLADPIAPAALDPYFLSHGPGLATNWTAYPGLYRARCRSADGVSWLQVTTVAGAVAHHHLSEPYGPAWGYHVEDVNLALGNLVDDVAAAEHTWSLTNGR